MVGVFAAGRLLSRPAKDGAPATGGGGGSTGNGLIWAAGNNITWGADALIWGTA